MLWDSRLEPDSHADQLIERAAAERRHAGTIVCQDDRCDRDDLHPPHEIVDTKRQASARQRLLGWVHDPFERTLRPARRSRTEHEPTHVLDSCVIEVCSYAVPKSMGMIHADLAHVYGNGVIERRLHRSLLRLSSSGQLLKIDLSAFHRGGNLNAYLLPSSRIKHDPAQIYETLTDRFNVGEGWSTAAAAREKKPPRLRSRSTSATKPLQASLSQVRSSLTWYGAPASSEMTGRARKEWSAQLRSYQRLKIEEQRWAEIENDR